MDKVTYGFQLQRLFLHEMRLASDFWAQWGAIGEQLGSCSSTVSECHFKYAKTAQKIQLVGRRQT